MQQTAKPKRSLLCIAAPQDVHLLASWEKHLLPLQQAGLISFWSERALQAGRERLTELLAHLNQADIVVLLLSADFFASDECGVLMDHALQRLRDGTGQVIPLLARPVLWRASSLGTLACLPTNEIAVTIWGDQDEGWHACVLGLQRMLGFSSSYVQGSSTEKRDQSDRGRLLRRLKQDYQRSQYESLERLAWIKLGLAEQPDAVRNAIHLLERRPDRSERMLPADTSILAAYDQAEEALLILGTPGAGKSTLLRDLALQLISRAQEDKTRPLPVILPLSSWAVNKSELSNWMVEQLSRIYDVPRKLGQQWVDQEQILPLLDGLDEMEEAARPLCVGAINAYRKEHMVPLAVCSRSVEYYAATIQHRLVLQNAVIIQPLTVEQIEWELQLGGEPLTGLREALQENQELRNFVTTPLMLSVFVLAYHGITVLDLPERQVALERRVWDDYVKRMVREKGGERLAKGDVPVKRYSLKYTCSFLDWLAQQMKVHNQTIFYGEYLQKSWLPASAQRSARWLTDLLPAILLGVASSLLLSLFLSEFTGWADLCRIGLLGGFLGWCLYLDRRNNASPKTQQTGIKHLVQTQSLYLLRAGGLALLLITSWRLDSWTIWRNGITDGATFLIGIWLLQVVLFKQSRQSKFSLVTFIPRWARVTTRFRVTVIRRVFWTITLLGSSIALCFEAGEMVGESQNFSLLSWIRIGLIIGATYFMIIWLFRAAFSSRSYWERLVAWFQTVPIRQAFWIIVIFSSSFALSTGLSYWLTYGWREGLDSGLSYGLGDSLIFGLPFGVTGYLLHRILDQQLETVRLAEQISWTWRPLLSFRHLQVSLYIALATPLLFGVSYWMIDNKGEWLSPFGYSFSSLLSSWFDYAMSTGLAYGLSLGLSYWLLLGIYEGITQKHMEDQDRRRFNQGLHRSSWNGGLLSLLGAAIICGISVLNGGLNYGLIFVLADGVDKYGQIHIGFTIGMQIGLGGESSFSLSHIVSNGLSDGMRNVWLILLLGWFVLWVATGGLTILRHYILRLLLAQGRTFPLRTRAFLDDAVARALLKRQGGGYTFVHRRLQDYFADTSSLTTSNVSVPQSVDVTIEALSGEKPSSKEIL